MPASIFLQQLSDRYNKVGIELSDDAIAKMQEYSWLGNVRELQYTIEKALILSDGNVIKASGLFLRQRVNDKNKELENVTLEEMERTLIERSIQNNENNISDNTYELIQNTEEALKVINSTSKGLIDFVNSYRKFTGIPTPHLAPIALQSVIKRSIALETASFEEKGIEVSINLDIYNNGQAIDKDILPNIFVPFFTTKQTGTGIGLSISRYIMRLHNGTLTHFVKDEWTVFRMTFYT